MTQQYFQLEKSQRLALNAFFRAEDWAPVKVEQTEAVQSLLVLGLLEMNKQKQVRLTTKGKQVRMQRD